MNKFAVTEVNGEFRADSRLLAPMLDIRHRNVLDNIKNYSSQLRELGLLPFQTEAVKRI